MQIWTDWLLSSSLRMQRRATSVLEIFEGSLLLQDINDWSLLFTVQHNFLKNKVVKIIDASPPTNYQMKSVFMICDVSNALTRRVQAIGDIRYQQYFCTENSTVVNSRTLARTKWGIPAILQIHLNGNEIPNWRHPAGIGQTLFQQIQ